MCKYHGTVNLKAMKWINRTLFLISTLHSLNFPSVTAAFDDVETFPIQAERDGRSGASVIYACKAGKETGPCVDTPTLCTSQGGRFVGYCFFDGKYEGVCCPGLDPANATLTTRPPAIHDDSTSAPPPTLPPATMTTQTFPPGPTMTTNTFPPAPSMTSDTLPPATMTTHSLPPGSTMTTQTMPPAPTMTTNTMPPAPSMTTQTMPPATMTTQSLPPSSTMTTQTMPPAPTMTSDTLPPAPTMTTQTMSPPTMTTQSMPPATMTTQSMPPAPTMTTQSMPPATMTTQSMPPAPTMTTETMPPAPTMSTQTPPPFPSFQPSSPGLHDDTTTAPTAPTMPTMSTQTMPPAPTMTQTMPPAPTMTTQTMPPGSTMTTQTMPPAPTMSTQTMPPAPTMTTQTMPPGSTMTTQTMPPAPTMTTQTMPPGSTMTTQTMPPAPTMTTQTMPPAPTMTTQSMPPATMTTQSMPPAPTMTTQSMPPAPTETTPAMPNPPTSPQTPGQPSETPPSMPDVPTAPQTPAPPTAPAPPNTPAPPTGPTQPPAHFDNSSTQHTFFPTQSFPTMTTRNQSMSTMNFTFTTEQMNFTTNTFPTMSTQNHSMSTMNFTFTTQQMNHTEEFNFTMTTRPMPNITGPDFPTTSTTTASSETDASSDSSATDATTQPSFDLPQDGVGCGIVSTDIESLFQNPSYPSLDTESNVYQYSVMPRDGFCALRVEFLESHLAGKSTEGCSVDSVVIINTVDTPTAPQCGLLQGYEFTVRQEQGQPVKIVVTTQSSAHLWSINATQIACSNIKPYEDYEASDCGIKNPKESPPGVMVINQNPKDEPKSIVPSRLLKSRRKTLRDLMSSPTLAPSKLLQSAVLNRETNIKIVRGNETGVNEYPWQALLMVNGRPLCGASIINENWIVTAGHCVQLNLRYPLTSVLTVDLGDHDLRTTKETKNLVSRVSKIVPNVRNEGVRNDIALIKLATKIPLGKTLRPVCLPQRKVPPDAYAGRNGLTTGWGRTEDSVISPVLREANLPILSNEKCRQQWSTVGEGGGNIIESGMICAGGGDVGPCNGDSGGPLIIQDEERYRLVGLTSFGLVRGCAVSGVPSVFTRVTSYLDWLALSLADA